MTSYYKGKGRRRDWDVVIYQPQTQLGRYIVTQLMQSPLSMLLCTNDVEQLRDVYYEMISLSSDDKIGACLALFPNGSGDATDLSFHALVAATADEVVQYGHLFINCAALEDCDTSNVMMWINKCIEHHSDYIDNSPTVPLGIESLAEEASRSSVLIAPGCGSWQAIPRIVSRAFTPMVPRAVYYAFIEDNEPYFPAKIWSLIVHWNYNMSMQTKSTAIRRVLKESRFDRRFGYVVPLPYRMPCESYLCASSFITYTMLILWMMVTSLMVMIPVIRDMLRSTFKLNRFSYTPVMEVSVLGDGDEIRRYDDDDGDTEIDVYATCEAIADHAILCEAIKLITLERSRITLDSSIVDPGQLFLYNGSTLMSASIHPSLSNGLERNHMMLPFNHLDGGIFSSSHNADKLKVVVRSIST